MSVALSEKRESVIVEDGLSGPACPDVAVLLAAYKAHQFLPQQLRSIQAQTHQRLHVWVSQDCDSSEVTNLLAQEMTLPWGKAHISVLKGPQRGFVQNFLSLVCNPAIQADYLAFSDQDDEWEADKLERAIAQLQKVPDSMPAVYCSRTCLIDEKGAEIGFSPLFSRKPSFTNALVQSIAGGNTMVLNKAARKLLLGVGAVDVVSHDWWVYMLVTGAGGRILYDDYPSIRYRQHGANIVGSNLGWRARLHRLVRLLGGGFSRWSELNLRALRQAAAMFTPENQKLLREFARMRKKRFFPRLLSAYRLGLYRQTRLGNVGLWLAIILKKI